MKNAIQMGTTIAHTPAADCPSGAATLIGARLGIAVTNVAANTEGQFAVEGVYAIAKLASDNVVQGTLLYWDKGNSRLTANASEGESTHVLAGYAFAAGAVGAGSVDIKINA